MRSEDVLARLSAHKPARKGASEAEMAAEISKRQMIAKLAAGVKKTEEAKGLRA
ncbi:hypothetical protein [Devosia sp. 2618]|uniref:hypothetical protein n=1 Tax=Devosia sp. 2618 TaxID=3156454 RepID=UPI00339B8433